MTWVEADHERTFEVDAPFEEVAGFFSDPSHIQHCMPDLKQAEKIDDQAYRWLLEEVGAKNITFQGDYTVRYERDGEEVTWETEGEGTMRCEGRASFESISDERTRVDYRETMASDLPVPRLAAKVFRPIVKREVKKGIDRYLDEAIAYLNAGRYGADDD